MSQWLWLAAYWSELVDPGQVNPFRPGLWRAESSRAHPLGLRRDTGGQTQEPSWTEHMGQWLRSMPGQRWSQLMLCYHLNRLWQCDLSCSAETWAAVNRICFVGDRVDRVEGIATWSLQDISLASAFSKWMSGQCKDSNKARSTC